MDFFIRLMFCAAMFCVVFCMFFLTGAVVFEILTGGL